MNRTRVTQELAIGDWSIATFVTGGNWKENCYLVEHRPTGEMALIDPGADDGEIAARVVAAGGRLCHLLLTHAHHDHVGAVAALASQFGVTCRLHGSDVRLLRHAPMYALRFSQLTIEAPGAHEVFGPDELTIGGTAIQILHCPGHTTGSVCLAWAGFAFTGDTLLHEIVGRVDLPGSQPEALVPSIEVMLASLPPATVLLPGHGRPWTISEARQWWTELKGPAPVYKEPRTTAQKEDRA